MTDNMGVATRGVRERRRGGESTTRRMWFAAIIRMKKNVWFTWR